MADMAQLERALFNADAAGDTQAATTLAAEIRRMRAAPTPVSQQASDMAAEGMGPLDAAAVAVGRGFDKTAMGLKELALRGVRAVAPPSFAGAADTELRSLAQQEAEKDAAYAGLQRARPFITGVGESAPAIVATAGMGVVPAALGMAVMEALKPGTTQERLTRGAMQGTGALAGGWIGNKIGKAVAPVADDMTTAAQREALKIAEKVGYKPRLSEVTGSPYLARLEDFAARTPGGAGVMADFARANQQAINQHAASGIGQRANQLTPDVFAAADKQLGSVFEAVKGLPGKPIIVNGNVGSVADDILRVQGKMLESERDATLTAIAKQAQVLSRNFGRIDGETYQLVRSGLSSAAHDATGTNKSLYGKLLAALDDSAETSLKAIGKSDLAAAVKEARPQWANLKTLERGAVSKGGDVTPSAVASALRTNNPKAFREGSMAGNPLYDIGVIGERLRPLAAGSPTYERELTSSLLDTAIKAGPAWAAAQLTTGALPRGYAGLLATNPTAGLLAQPIAQIAEPGGRALGGLLTQRLLIPSIPIFAE